ncbi:sulfite exporter TauE/SafE family protein [Pedobacter sp. SD-b]|uniref:Probable membrane transporter protein n=1 Tax=Pedobacter segetis TaxID=2793069 RepID=A0ABS1BM22_9SPHI|nr:sulfite exporter TauE/SafE family protein [Pedobacter segetis]MBK0383832.1 sulfite exporter TauE/SafE family protein [Pedobacter segetis]
MGFHIYLTYFLALFIGISLGLTGGGGSILTVPVLVYAARLEPVIATAYSLFIVGFTSLVGAFGYIKKGIVNIRMAIIFAVPAFITVWLMRKFVIHAMPAQLFTIGNFTLTKDLFLMLFFALIMLISGFKMVHNIKKDSREFKEINYGLVLINGIVVGILSGLVGAGGGFLIVPALVFFMGLPIHKAVGTSLLIIAINSLIGFTGDILNLPYIDWQFLFVFSAISSLGIFFGIYLNQYLNSERLKKVFGYFVLIMAVVILFKELL